MADFKGEQMNLEPIIKALLLQNLIILEAIRNNDKHAAAEGCVAAIESIKALLPTIEKVDCILNFLSKSE